VSADFSDGEEGDETAMESSGEDEDLPTHKAPVVNPKEKPQDRSSGTGDIVGGGGLPDPHPA